MFILIFVSLILSNHNILEKSITIPEKCLTLHFSLTRQSTFVIIYQHGQKTKMLDYVVVLESNLSVFRRNQLRIQKTEKLSQTLAIEFYQFSLKCIRSVVENNNFLLCTRNQPNITSNFISDFIIAKKKETRRLFT